MVFLAFKFNKIFVVVLHLGFVGQSSTFQNFLHCVCIIGISSSCCHFWKQSAWTGLWFKLIRIWTKWIENKETKYICIICIDKLGYNTTQVFESLSLHNSELMMWLFLLVTADIIDVVWL